MSFFLPSLKKSGHLDQIQMTVCIVGSRKIVHDDDYASKGWDIFAPHLTIYGFDADVDACDQMNSNLEIRKVNWTEKHIPLALWNSAGRSTLHITNFTGSSSLYQPNELHIKRFSGYLEWHKQVSSLEINTTTLDDFCQANAVTEIDFLQIDTQGAELRVLEGASRMLEHSILAIATEVEFTDLYINQPLFSDLDLHLRKQNFTLLDLAISTGRGCRTSSPIVSKAHPGSLIWADAFYFRDLIRDDLNINLKTPKQIFKLACIADVLDFPDYSLELLEYLTTRYGNDLNYNFASNIIESLAQVPELAKQGLESFPVVARMQDYAIGKSLSNSNSLMFNRNNYDNSAGYPKKLKKEILIIIDSVFFQLHNTGIARVWKSLLEEWTDNGFAKHIVVLDRAGTAPKIPGIRYRTLPLYDYDSTSTDREILQQVCDEEGANLFISTYYTTPLSTPSVFMAYDMIPEVTNVDLETPMWREKHEGIHHASAFIAISESTAHDLVKVFPDISPEAITVAHCGVESTFSPLSPEEVSGFKTKYSISKPYFILVGERLGVNNYKNTLLFFKAFSQLPNYYDFDIVCVGGQPVLEPRLRDYVPDQTIHTLQLSDDELQTAYSGAIALIYPSKYEGFGLPIVEAMACGCPVITCPNASIPEVAGEAALYIYDNDVNGLVNALCEVQKPDVRNPLIAAGLEQAKKFSWSAMAKTVSSALTEAAYLAEQKSVSLPSSLMSLSSCIEQYQRSAEQSVLAELCQARRQLADLWLGTSVEQLVDAYRSSIGKAHQTLLNSGIKNEQLSNAEQIFVADLASHIAKGCDEPKAIQYLLAAMLYSRADQLPLQYDLTRIPYWLLKDYLQFLLDSPHYLHEIGEADGYYQYMAQLVGYLHNNIVSNPNSKLWKDIAIYFTEKANFVPLYFNNTNLKNIYTKRADIIGFSLENRGCQIDYEFPERSSERKKICLGILATHFGPQTETFATLPVYKHLNRDLFEIILFALNTSNHRLERYCAGHADALVKLPADLPSQVQTIREAELDILFISTNVTLVTHQVTSLALHRLARLQIVDANSPVTTGMRNVDYYISSKLSELEAAQQHYTETLVTLDCPPQCFDFGTEEQLLTTTSISRESLGISKNAVVYISGANYYKIIPELEAAWARVIANVANSVLLLYPFNPNWSSSYPAMVFQKRIAETFAKHGMSDDRLMILDSAPNRADIKERLKLGDVYLDSYPYSGMTSLIDPLEVSLPTVVWEAEFSRSKKGASLLRELQTPDLITDSEEAYIELAIALGTNPELRKQKSDQIKQRMQANPRFLDSRAYSAQMGALFQELFRKQQVAALKDNLKLRDINLIIFPDWSQPEDSLLQDLVSVVRAVVAHPDKSQMTLLIDTGDISQEDANLALSTVVMNLLMEEDLDVTDGPEISLVGRLSELQWQALLPHIQARIALEHENQPAILLQGRYVLRTGVRRTHSSRCANAIAAVKADNIKSWTVDDNELADASHSN